MPRYCFPKILTDFVPADVLPVLPSWLFQVDFLTLIHARHIARFERYVNNCRVRLRTHAHAVLLPYIYSTHAIVATLTALHALDCTVTLHTPFYNSFTTLYVWFKLSSVNL